MPENEAPVGAFYDHETEEPRATGRRRRQVADWGVGEDVFDRLPSRRFARAEHRSHTPRHEPERPARDRGRESRHPEVADWAVEPEPRADARREAADWDEPRAVRREAADWADEPRGPARREAADWDDEPRTRRFAPADADRHEPEAPVRRRPAAEPARRARRPAADWLAEVTPPPAPEPELEADVDLDTGGGRTIVLEGELAPEAPKPRRTIVIGGHPDKLPAPRPRRPPRTAVERLGASPDRIMAYAVGLGLLLILIAVLTTSH